MLKKSYIVSSAGRCRSFDSAVDVRNLLTPFRPGVKWILQCRVSDGSTAVIRKMAECDGKSIHYVSNKEVPSALKVLGEGVKG